MSQSIFFRGVSSPRLESVTCSIWCSCPVWGRPSAAVAWTGDVSSAFLLARGVWPSWPARPHRWSVQGWISHWTRAISPFPRQPGSNPRPSSGHPGGCYWPAAIQTPEIPISGKSAAKRDPTGTAWRPPWDAAFRFRRSRNHLGNPQTTISSHFHLIKHKNEKPIFTLWQTFSSYSYAKKPEISSRNVATVPNCVLLVNEQKIWLIKTRWALLYVLPFCCCLCFFFWQSSDIAPLGLPLFAMLLLFYARLVGWCLWDVRSINSGDANLP